MVKLWDIVRNYVSEMCGSDGTAPRRNFQQYSAEYRQKSRLRVARLWWCGSETEFSATFCRISSEITAPSCAALLVRLQDGIFSNILQNIVRNYGSELWWCGSETEFSAIFCRISSEITAPSRAALMARLQVQLWQTRFLRSKAFPFPHVLKGIAKLV